MALCIGIFGQSFATGIATASAVDVIKRELALSGYAGGLCRVLRCRLEHHKC